MSRFRQFLGLILGDADVERVRRNHEDAIRELQNQPGVGLGIVPNVELKDGVATLVPHKLGRVPSFVDHSIVRGATATGRIVETRDGTVDRGLYVKLTATGWGATITLDLEVM